MSFPEFNLPVFLRKQNDQRDLDSIEVYWPDFNECRYCLGDVLVSAGQIECGHCGNCGKYSQNGEKYAVVGT